MSKVSLPMGWEIKKLGEVYDVRDGTHDSPKYQDDGYPLITSKNLKKDCLSFENIKFISEENYLKINARSAVHRGDILYAMIGTIGNPIVVEVEPDFAIKNVALIKVTEGEHNSYFLKYYLESQYVQLKMQREAKGTTQKFVGLGYLRNFPILLPPIPEQQRIVAILDNAFASIASATTYAKKNHRNAHELLDSTISTIFTEKGEGWVEKRLENVCTLQRGFDLPKRLRQEGETPLVSSSGIIDSHIESKVIGPGIVTGRSGSIGNVFYIKDDFWPLNTTLYVKDFHGNDVQFVYYLLKHFDLNKYTSGAGVPTLNRNNVHDLKVNIPSDILEQQAIVNQLDSLTTETKRLEAIYQKKLAALVELKQSLLQQAFAGEL